MQTPTPYETTKDSPISLSIDSDSPDADYNSISPTPLQATPVTIKNSLLSSNLLPNPLPLTIEANPIKTMSPPYAQAITSNLNFPQPSSTNFPPPLYYVPEYSLNAIPISNPSSVLPLPSSHPQTLPQPTNPLSVVPSLNPESDVSALSLLPGGPNGQDTKYIDITEFLSLPQSQAAKKLSVPTSTLSKRWKEAVRNRKWPYRAVCKLDKEIMTILYNIPQGSDQAEDLPPDVKAKLGRLLRERQDLLKPVIIRL